MSDGEAEETKQDSRKEKAPKSKAARAKVIVHENFPDSDKEEENEGSEGIDEGFL